MAVLNETKETESSTGEAEGMKAHAGEAASDETTNSSIKKQLRDNIEKVSLLSPVAEILYGKLSKKELVLRALNEFKKIGYAVHRQNFGIIEIGEQQIKKAVNKYVNTEAEKAALLSVPAVLKRGVEISGHDNHKNRGYETITIAAPVKINGTVGVVAVIVRKLGKIAITRIGF